MRTQSPTATRVIVAAGFAVSCFAIALFLWIAFGGPIPLKPEGYRFTVPFGEAAQLATEADVRISGVPVGSVKRIDLDAQGRAEATIELESDHAPVPVDTRAILRQKTLLGETYVELTPGSPDSATVPEGGSLEAGQVAESVELDEIFRTFDARTRAGFQAWMQGAAVALRGRGEDLSTAIASLDPFAAEADRALRILDSQRLAVRRLVRDGGEVAEALGERDGQLRDLITNADAVFETTARRDRELAELFVILPTFLDESRATLERTERFAAETDPLISQLRPAARELSPTLTATGELAPDLERFLSGLRRTISAAPRGFQGLRDLLDDDLPPLLTRLDPFLGQLTPIATGLRRYRRETTAFLANLAATTNAEAVDPTGTRKYVRTVSPLNPELLSAYANRLEINRSNPYVAPGGARRLRGGLRSFETRQCTGGAPALLDPLTATNPTFIDRVRRPGDGPGEAEERAERLFDGIQEFAFLDGLDSNDLPAPPCRKQGPFRSIGALTELSDYLHVRALP